MVYPQCFLEASSSGVSLQVRLETQVPSTSGLGKHIGFMEQKPLSLNLVACHLAKGQVRCLPCSCQEPEHAMLIILWVQVLFIGWALLQRPEFRVGKECTTFFRA